MGTFLRQGPIAAFTVAKHPLDPAPNEDAFAIDSWRGIIALSDGASESYDSAAWARVLVDQFAINAHFGSAWLGSACARYGARYHRESLGWSAQAAYDRGSFATLIGLALHRSGKFARVLGIGDSLAVLVDGDTMLDSFPYTDPSQFQQRPLLLCTAMARNGAVLAGAAQRRYVRTWPLGDVREPIILCMTDALGAWLLSDPAHRLPLLLKLKRQDQFERLIERERATGSLKRDDTTLVRVG